jgi:tetratricopeptide (TPR) repeat protein
LISKGDAAGSVAEIKRALDLDPLSLHTSAAVTMMLYFSRQYDEAIEHGVRTIEMDSTFFPAYLFLGLAYVERKQYSEAVAALQKGTEHSGNITLMQASVASAFAFAGKTEEAGRILNELEQPRGYYVSKTSIAAVYSGLGDVNAALTALEQAYDDRCSWLLRALVADPRLDRLRDQPRFHDLSRRAGVAAQIP